MDKLEKLQLNYLDLIPFLTPVNTNKQHSTKFYVKTDRQSNLIICPKCGKPAYVLADATTKNTKRFRYVYSRYKHPKKIYGKEKICYIKKERISKRQELIDYMNTWRLLQTLYTLR